MKQYKLGPNGAIVTSLNLFSTKFPEVINYIEKAKNYYCILDTPGQIEVFTWSVSGNKMSTKLFQFQFNNLCYLCFRFNYY